MHCKRSGAEKMSERVRKLDAFLGATRFLTIIKKVIIIVTLLLMRLEIIKKVVKKV